MENRSPKQPPFDPKMLGVILMMKSLRSLTLLPFMEILQLYSQAAARRDIFQPHLNCSFPDREVKVSLN